MLVPMAKLAEAVVPVGTFKPAGVERTLSPPRPVAVRVSVARAPTPHTFGTPPPPQVWGAVHTPQVSVPPQPLEIVPQVAPCAAHVVGVQPQTLGTPPPPQVCGAVQVPQVSVPPHPLGTVPHVAPWAAQVVPVVQHVQLARQRPGQTALSVPSHCSVG